MKPRRIGISIGRRRASLAGIDLGGAVPAIALSRCWDRPRGKASSEVLETLLESLPSEWRNAEVCLALSPADLACADSFDVPYGSESQIEGVAQSLAESRCAGETAEDLVVDFALWNGDRGVTAAGKRIEVLAIRQEVLEALRAVVRRVLPLARLKLVTSIPSALSWSVKPTGTKATAILAGGEGVLIPKPNGLPLGWRVFPLDGDEKEGAQSRIGQVAKALGFSDQSLAVFREGSEQAEIELRTGGLRGRPDVIGALAAAAAGGDGKSESDPDGVANLLRNTKDAPRGFSSRLRNPILGTLLASSVFLGAVGLFFDQRVRQARADEGDLANRERVLWREFGEPSEPFQGGALLPMIQRRVSGQAKLADSNSIVSALSVWSEIAAVMPDADRLGLTLESFNVDSEGARLFCRVSAPPGDPLANASFLENALNQSDQLTASGEFERKEDHVVVRMRIGYHPRATPGLRERKEGSP